MKVCYYLCDQALSNKSRGIWTYTKELISALQESGEVDIRLLTSPSGPFIDGVPHKILPVDSRRLPGRVLADHVNPLFLPDADLYHYPKGFLPAVRKRSRPHVAFIHDTIVVHYHDNYRGCSAFKPFELEYWVWCLSRSLKQADMVLTNSRKSAEAIEVFCDSRKLPMPPVVVTPLASKYQGLPGEKAAKGDYVLHLASSLPHKRTNWLLDNWLQLEESGADLPVLRLVGNPDPAGTHLASRSKKIEMLPPVTDQELRGLFVGAKALVYPSEIEGFGLPALEAYQLGTPVLYVAGTSVEEILTINGEPAPGRFELQLDDFKRALDEALGISDATLSSVQHELLQEFSWQKTARQTLAAYRRLVEG